jgi:hypothetical protein
LDIPAKKNNPLFSNIQWPKEKKEKGEQYLQNVHKENNRLGKTIPTKNSDAPEV